MPYSTLPSMSSSKLLGAIVLLGTLLLSSTAYSESTSPIIVPGLSLIYDASDILSGGYDQAVNNRALLEISADIDTDRLRFGADSNIFISAQALRGADASIDAGVLQPFSNIDAEEFSKFYEIWYQRTYNKKLRLKIGQLDANTEFAVSEQAGNFMHSSMGFSPTILTFPSYPDPALSANAFYSINDLISLSIGVYDSTSDRDFQEVFSVGELRFNYSATGSLKLGTWFDSNAIETLDGMEEPNTHGYFFLLDHLISLSNDKGKLGLFLQYGNLQNDVSLARHHLGAGGVWHTPLGASQLTAGLGVSALDLSDEARIAIGNNREVAVEAFLAYSITNFLTLKPTYSYVSSPSLYPGLDNVSILTLRSEIAF